MTKRDLLSIADLNKGDLERIIERASILKRDGSKPLLAGKTMAMIFEKPSLRTRVSFDLAVHQLGGHPLYLGRDEVGLGKREPVADVARVLSRYVDAIVARTFAHKTLEELAAGASVPVINALSDAEHPCQALADLLTAQERHGRLKGLAIAYVGDGSNNVAVSLALAAASVGAHCTIASPQGYALPGPVLERAKGLAQRSGATVRQVRRPEDAAKGADVVYTDVWVSMGQEAETEERRRSFQGYQVTPDLMKLAKGGAIFMHPLPAHQGEEVAVGMLDHPQSAVFDQAENRLHAQKAVLELLAGGGKG